MKPQNLIVLSLDEVRPDHLSCYGYDRIKTPNIDRIAKDGVLFETCIASSCLTPICMSSVLSGVNPPVHGLRDPFSVIGSKMVSEILKDRGYKTSAFVGNGLLGPTHGFKNGFDFFDEPTEEGAWVLHSYPGTEDKGKFYEGNWWVDRLVSWLEDNASSPFFVWGHHYETHEGAEKALLRRGLLEEGKLSEFSYYDAKIKLADEKVLGPIFHTLQELAVFEDTTVVVMSDHGTTLGEHPANPIPWRDGVTYPQHTTMHDTDLRIALVMKGKGLPRNKRVKGMAREIDLAPTLLQLLGVNTIHQFGGIDLRPFIESGEVRGLVAYAEELFDKRGPGDFQAIRTDRYKYIVDRRHENTEQFYDLENDPGEQTNIIDILDEDEQLLLKEAREVTDTYLGTKTDRVRLSEQETEKIKWRLRTLGYTA
jgi:choline-sulfatase